MTDSFGFGRCCAGTESRLPCSEAAVDSSGCCRWHGKLAKRTTRRLEPDDKPATTRKKAATK
jgi:hypothetical protein